MIRPGDKVKIIKNPKDRKYKELPEPLGKIGEIVHRSDDGKSFIIRFDDIRKDLTFGRECISKIEEA